MSVIPLVIGSIFIVLGLAMQANRAGYIYFVIGPRSVLALAGMVAVLGAWFLLAVR